MNSVEHLPSFQVSKAIEFAKSGDKLSAINYLQKAMVSANAGSGNQNKSKFLFKLVDKVKDNFKIDFHSPQTEVNSPPLQEYEEKLLPGISLVTCCMNRNDNLLNSISSWVQHSEISEIVVVDWSSTYPANLFLRDNNINDKRIKVVRVNNEPRWILSYAFNLGFRMATHDKILKTDADIIIKKNFFKKNTLDDNTFIAGDWRKADKGQEHINGFFYIKKSDLMQVNAFNEYITSYGWDDDDLYERIHKSGIERKCVDIETIYHIQHEDSTRIDKAQDNTTESLEHLHSKTAFKIQTNRYLSFLMPPWKNDKEFLKFNVIKESDNHIVVERNNALITNTIPKHIKNDAEYYATIELIFWRCGVDAYHLDRETVDRLISNKHIDNITPFDIQVLKENSAISIRKRTLAIEFDGDLSTSDKATALNHLIQKIDHNDDLTIFILHGTQDDSEIISKWGCPAYCGDKKDKIDNFYKSDIQDFSTLNNVLQKEYNVYFNLNNHHIQEFITKKAPVSIIKKPRLYIDAQHGLGNRLRAFASAHSIAKATERELVLIWEPDNHCNCLFSDLFDYDGMVLDESFTEDAAQQDCEVFNYMEIEPNAEKDAEILIQKDKDTYIRSAYCLNNPHTNWDIDNNFLKSLTPSSGIMDIIDSFDVKNMIGVHIRMEGGNGLDQHTYEVADNWTKEGKEQLHYWRGKSHYSNFIRYINEILKKDNGHEFFLASDMEETYNIMTQHFGSRMTYLKRDVYDRSREQIRYALADVLLLSKCKKLIASSWSSFSELAMRLSDTYTSIKMSGKDF